MSASKFHLGWFANFCTDAWNDQWGATGGQDWTGSFYIELAQHLERAKFDYLLLEDKLMVSDAYGGSFERELKHALHSPKHDPAPLIPLLGMSPITWGWWSRCPPPSIRLTCWLGCAAPWTISPVDAWAGTW